MPYATTAEFSLQWPALGVCRVPYQVFTDAALYALEQERIFRGDAWHWLGLEVETPNPGNFKIQRLGDTPVIMVRNAEGAMKAFVNRCAHRGAMLCVERRGHANQSHHAHGRHGRVRGGLLRRRAG